MQDRDATANGYSLTGLKLLRDDKQLTASWCTGGKGIVYKASGNSFYYGTAVTCDCSVPAGKYEYKVNA